MIDKLTDLISTNKISSVEVSDAIGKDGVIKKLSALNIGNHVVGRVHYVCTWGESNWALHEQIQSVQENDIVYIDAIECNDRAVLGDIVCKQLFLYQKVKALVVNGYVRDAHRLIKEKYPIWMKGVTPVGCSNKWVSQTAEISTYINRQSEEFSNSLLVCDDSGCTLIKKENMNSNLINNLEYIELQEDIWYFCLDTLKMNSYEIICQKKYLEEEGILPESLLTRMKAIKASMTNE